MVREKMTTILTASTTKCSNDSHSHIINSNSKMQRWRQHRIPDQEERWCWDQGKRGWAVKMELDSAQQRQWRWLPRGERNVEGFGWVRNQWEEDDVDRSRVREVTLLVDGDGCWRMRVVMVAVGRGRSRGRRWFCAPRKEMKMKKNFQRNRKNGLLLWPRSFHSITKFFF